MPLWLDILLIALAVAAGACGAYWTVGSVRVLGNLRAVPTARAGLRLPVPGGSVCVVVPAHNEAGKIGKLVRSLREQDHPAMRVVLALDRCTDATEPEALEAIAGDPRFEIVRVTACPEGWAGKVNAVWTGVRASAAARDADLLLFTDADCVFHPRALSATAALLRERRLALLSLLSTLFHDAWFEKLVQPAAGFELTRQYPPRRCNPRGDDPAAPRPFANGQFMLFDAAAYRAAGGHESVRDELLEDIAIARLMGERGMRTGCLLAAGIVRCRMYDTWEQFRRGWKRIYTEASKRRVARLRKAAWVKRVFGALLPCAAGDAVLIGTLAGTLGEWNEPAVASVACGLWGLSASLWAWGMVYRSSGAPLWAMPGFVVGCWLTGDILAEAADDLDRGVKTSWGGREYAREAR